MAWSCETSAALASTIVSLESLTARLLLGIFRPVTPLQMKSVLLKAITAYQQHLSPHKGFRCAFHAHTGRGSCSGYGHRVIARFGAMRGLRLLRRRLADCRVVASQNRKLSRLPNSPQRTTRDWRREGGFCDGCDDCDLSSCSMPSRSDLRDIVSQVRNPSSNTRAACVGAKWCGSRLLVMAAIVAAIVTIIFIALNLWLRWQK